MTTKTKTELAIDFIAKNETARSPEIAETSGIPEKGVCTMLYHYVRGGVLVSCRVSQMGKASCNEYRLATGVTAQNWRDFKVGLFSEANKNKAPLKRITPPAPTPVDQPQVSVNNSGSTSAENSSLAATGRAVTVVKPHRKATQRAPGVGGHVDQKADWALHSDGSLMICAGAEAICLTKAEAIRLADFLMVCDLERLKDPA